MKIDWKKDWWVIVIFGVLVAFSATDPVVWGWLAENWFELVSLASLFALTAAISFYWGYRQGSAKGYSQGFENGLRWK